MVGFEAVFFPPLLCTFFALQFFFSEHVWLLKKKNSNQNYSREGLPNAQAALMKGSHCFTHLLVVKLRHGRCSKTYSRLVSGRAKIDTQSFWPWPLCYFHHFSSGKLSFDCKLIWIGSGGGLIYCNLSQDGLTPKPEGGL